MADGIKIGVAAEFDGKPVEQGVDRIEKAAERLEKTFSGIEKAVDGLNKALDRTDKTVQKVAKTKFSPIDRPAIKLLDEHTNKVEKLLKISPGLNRRLNMSEQAGTPFDQWNWQKMYPDPARAAAAKRNAQAFVMGGSPQQPPDKQGSGWAAAGKKVVSAGLNASGSVGQAANAGLSGGMAGGLAGFAGGIAAFALGKAIGAVAENVGQAQQESIGYDTIKRTLGDVNVGFNTLRDSLRASAASFDATFEESQKMGLQFAKISNMGADQHKTLADEVRVSGGFGRSYGLDPSESNQFFAQMRQFKVTGNDQDSRKLALMIGESIGKSGSFAKADEMLQQIANYTAQQSRMGLSSANVPGYSAMLAGLVGSKVPGLDPTGAANVLGRANNAIASGGGAGEAGQFFMQRAIGTRLGIDPIQTAILREQGAFGTANKTFGKDSLYSKFADKFGMSNKSFGAEGDQTTMSMIVAELQKQYKGRPDLMLNATSNLLGMNHSQAMSVHAIPAAQLGQIESRMGRLGIDPRSVSTTGWAALARVQDGDRSVLNAQGKSLLGRTGADALSGKEADSLRSAMAGKDEEKLRDVLTVLTASREQELTEGANTRKSIALVERAIMEQAGKLVPIANDMRTGIMYLAGDKGRKSKSDMEKALVEGQYKDDKSTLKVRNKNEDEALDAEVQAIRKEKRKNTSGLFDSKEEIDAKKKRYKELEEKEKEILAKKEEAYKKHDQAVDDLTKQYEADLLKIKAGTYGVDAGAVKPGDAPVPDAGDAASGGAGAGAGAVAGAMIGKAGAGGGAASGQSVMGSYAGYAGTKSGKTDPKATETAMKFFMAKGWTAEQAAGIVANLHAESKMNPNSIGDKGLAYGIAQWHPDRQADFERQYGKSIRGSSVEEQMEFVHFELTQGKKKAVGEALKKQNSRGGSGALISDKYEIPAARQAEAIRRAGIAEGIATPGNSEGTPLPMAMKPSDGGMFRSHLTFDPFEIMLRQQQADGRMSEQKVSVPVKVATPSPKQGQ